MSASPDRLAAYKARRDFSKTQEPEGSATRSLRNRPSFVVQKHAASRLHYDFRLEWDGTLLSWAVTKGPSADPGQKRLAVRTEDHPLDYGNFEGTIPKGEYGGGTVMLWDSGYWVPQDKPDDGLSKGKLSFTLHGERMKGSWALVRMRRDKRGGRENWLLIKHDDEFAGDRPDRLTERHATSVATGRTMDEIASADEVGERQPGPTRQRRRKPPRFRALQLAGLYDAPPKGDSWMHETKFDGYRCLVAIGKGGPRLYSRSGKDWSDTFAALADAFDDVHCDAALIDGEVMARNIRGSAFSSLQRALADGGPLVFFAFDLIALDGKDFAGKPQSERRQMLAQVLSPLAPDGPVRMSEHVVGDGAAVFAAACRSGAEGIVSKRLDAPYKAGRTALWRKVKCTKRQEFVVGGYMPSGKRPFASLLLGEHADGRLHYRGRVGTGFCSNDFETLSNAMTARKTSPFDDVPQDVGRTAHWVRPDVVVETEFAEITADGHIRHGSYLGMRDDKSPRDVRAKTGMDASSGQDRETATVRGISISSARREVFPKAGLTKLDLARYYDRAGKRLTETAGHRPLSLVRCPTGIDGECFFQKHAHKGFPKELKRIEIEESDGSSGEYLYASSPKAFVAAAQFGTIEFHIGGARVDRLDRPDRLVFDLDPDEGLGWAEVRSAAFDLRDRLADLGLSSIPLVTGGKGIHVCVALRRTRTWDTVRLFAKTLAHIVADAEPKRYTATMSKKQRKGRIFIDWLRNGQGATAISPYSLRARPGAPVAMPLHWDDLANVESAADFRLESAVERLDEPCPYLATLDDLQTLSNAVVTRLGRHSAL